MIELRLWERAAMVVCERVGRAVWTNDQSNLDNITVTEPIANT